ncbi:MAG: hypothetical protein AAF184_11825 [Pseudomonadota bacterium]
MTLNSSEGDNDYFEEPLSGPARKYATALEVSNQFVESFGSGDAEAVYALLDPRLQQVFSMEELTAFMERISGNIGPLVEFKPMQWGFSTFGELPNIVVSTKIAIHENTEVFYVLNFPDDGSYKGLVGLNVSPKAPGESLSDGANRAHGLQ